MPTRTHDPVAVKVMLCADCNGIIPPGTYYTTAPQGNIHQSPCDTKPQSRPLPLVGAARA